MPATQTKNKKTAYRLTFKCTLDEDMHAGSGLGWLRLVDDLHARDAKGRPVVWHTTLASLLRNVADELYELNKDLSDAGKNATSIKGIVGIANMHERIVRLFGREGASGRSEMVVRSLHFSREQDDSDSGPSFLLVKKTARELHSRRPLDQSLRTIEMAAAGLVATGEIRFSGDASDLTLIETCLQRLMAMGGGRTRGMGRLTLSEIKTKESTNTAFEKSGDSPIPCKQCRIRLLLRCLEPVCLPKTGYPGNIITSETYISGQRLRGAFLTALNPIAEAVQVDTLANPKQVQFGNAYYIPESLIPRKADWKRLLPELSSIPLPLSAQEVKASEVSVENADIPWWAQDKESSTRWRADPNRERDVLLLSENDRTNQGYEHPGFKRIKQEEYLISADNGVTFHRAAPRMMTLMRNRVPVHRAGRENDSRRASTNVAAEAGQLFSEMVIAEDQLFLVDILLAEDGVAKTFREVIKPFVIGTPEGRRWLRVGRGGRPMRVEACQEIPKDSLTSSESNRPQEEKRSFTLTLTSDLIARSEDLGFLTTLDGAALLRLAGIEPEANGGTVVVDVNSSVYESRIIHGFNTAAGARRMPALAIARGSAFIVRDSVSDGALFDELVTIEKDGRGIGERTEEGFGRFVVDHNFHRMKDKNKKNDTADQVSDVHIETQTVELPPREAVLDYVIQAIHESGLKTMVQDSDFPSKNQWQTLRHSAEVCKRQDKLEKLLADLVEHSKLLGGRQWAKTLKGADKGPSLCEWLKDSSLVKETDFSFQRDFIVYVARWVIVQMNHKRQEKE